MKIKFKIKKYINTIKMTWRHKPYIIYYSITIIAIINNILPNDYGLFALLFSPIKLFLKYVWFDFYVNLKVIIFGIDLIFKTIGGIFLIVGFISQNNHNSRDK